jgi:hypothetical protein
MDGERKNWINQSDEGDTWRSWHEGECLSCKEKDLKWVKLFGLLKSWLLQIKIKTLLPQNFFPGYWIW